MTSGGASAGAEFEVLIDGIVVPITPGQNGVLWGMNMVVINPYTLKVVSAQNYDTSTMDIFNQHFKDDLTAVPDGFLIVLGTYGDGYA